MRPLVISTFVTLDGVMEAPGGEPSHPHTGWVADRQGPDQVQYKFDEVREAGSLLLGRVTYESFADAWPHYQGAFAERINAMPKQVVSTTLRDPAWHNTTVIGGDVLGRVRELRAQDGGPILVHGSRTLAQTLIAAGLCDELRLMTFPVLLGSGARLFPDTPHQTPLRLTGTRVFEFGVLLHSYVPAAADGSAADGA